VRPEKKGYYMVWDGGKKGGSVVGEREDELGGSKGSKREEGSACGGRGNQEQELYP